ncbi:MAG: VOC family protein, partial [Deltaproteobacteria bacterium]
MRAPAEATKPAQAQRTGRSKSRDSPLNRSAGDGSAGTCHARGMLHSLDHVMVVVRDLEEATRQTEALFGRKASWRGIHTDAGSANALFRLSNTYLELISPVGAGFAGRALEAALEQQGEGELGLAFGTDDAEACAARLRAAGLPVRDPWEGEGHSSDSDDVRHWR